MTIKLCIEVLPSNEEAKDDDDCGKHLSPRYLLHVDFC